MRRLWLEFTHPWLLLLLIPAIALVLIPYFRTAKRFRRTRNKITTVVLQLIVMVLSITVLSGLTVHAEINNKNNKVILLVDVSDTEETAQESRDNFVSSALHAGKFDKFDIGIVTFGYNQVYAVPFTDKTKDAYNKYLSAPKPDTTATDIASALTYAAGLFPENCVGKIVLVSDGKETDNEALSVIRAISAKGITVDAANIKSGFTDKDVMVTSVEMPDYHVAGGEVLNLKVTVSGSNFKEKRPGEKKESAKLVLYDNGKEVVSDPEKSVVGSAEIEVDNGEQSVNLSVLLQGNDPLHRLEVRLVQNSGGALEQNDSYTTYYLVEVFDRVLILERGEKTGEGSYANSDALVELLKGEGFTPTVVNVSDEQQAGSIPKSVDELRLYDQVILNNISNADLEKNKNVPEQFVKNLYSYVHDFGGGLFTTGGQDETGTKSNAYRREDLYGTLLQSMLPVQAIEYTSPVAVMIIIDRSGSMSTAAAGGFTCLEWAKQAAGESLNALTERDYVGVMTLDSYENYIIPLTPMTQKESVLSSLRDKLETTGGGTVFTPAIQTASIALKANKMVDRRHIIVISDGAMSDNKEALKTILHNNYISDKITLSVVGINIADKDTAVMQELIDAAGGQDSGVEGGRKVLSFSKENLDKLPPALREELQAPQIKAVNDKQPFNVSVYDKTSNIVKGMTYITEEQTIKDPKTGEDIKISVSTSQLESPKLGRFYGTKVRSKDYLVLTGDYEVPLYAQWKFGKGTVGSLMTDLQGTHGANNEFMQSAVGKKLIGNIVSNLMPVSSVRQAEMNIELDEDNYTNRVNIFTTLNDGETIEGTITDVAEGETSAISMNAVTERHEDDAVYVTMSLSESNGYGRCLFTVRKAGVYLITLTKKDAEGNVISVSTKYKSFAYSEEYDTSIQNKEIDYNAEFFIPLTEAGKGLFIPDVEDPSVIYDNFQKTLERVFDPRYAFMIIAIVLFITEIAVRKFKFKWPHEIIGALMAKKRSTKG